MEPKVPENAENLLFIRFSTSEVSRANENPPYLENIDMKSKVFSFSCLALLCTVPSLAQAPPQVGQVAMNTKIGSFKITSPGDQLAYGKIKMTFRGSCLIVGYDGKIPLVASPSLHVEYKDDKRQRIEYHGTGSITLEGRFRAIEWFGRDLNMDWSGLGICRVYGEFDKDGNTGTYTIKNKKTQYWGSGGMQFVLPPRDVSDIAPKVKINGGG